MNAKKSKGPKQKPAAPAAETQVAEAETKAMPLQRIIEAAAAAHEANRAYCQSIGDDSQLPWDEAPQWQRDSAINGVEFALKNNFPSPEAMHDNWCEAKLADGWMYGPEKDPEKKTHPCLVGYPSLPEAQRMKDEIFRETIMEVLSAPALPGPDLSSEAKADALAEMDISEADRQSITDAAEKVFEDAGASSFGRLVYDDEFAACVFLAFYGTSAMVEGESWGNIPFELAVFFTAEPTAPGEAGLTHLRLKTKEVLLPNEDPRRVMLALNLFKAFLAGVNGIEKEDADRAAAAKAAADAANAPRPRIDPDEMTMMPESGPELSDLGRSLSRNS